MGREPELGHHRRNPLAAFPVRRAIWGQPVGGCRLEGLRPRDAQGSNTARLRPFAVALRQIERAWAPREAERARPLARGVMAYLSDACSANRDLVGLRTGISLVCQLGSHWSANWDLVGLPTGTSWLRGQRSAKPRRQAAASVHCPRIPAAQAASPTRRTEDRSGAYATRVREHRTTGESPAGSPCPRWIAQRASWLEGVNGYKRPPRSPPPCVPGGAFYACLDTGRRPRASIARRR